MNNTNPFNITINHSNENEELINKILANFKSKLEQLQNEKEE